MDQVINIVERSNQRGGRMLSVIDLIMAGTLNKNQVCWLLHKIENGASWMVGAKPGGAGKTTIMSALLTMLPESESIRLTNPATDWMNASAGECIVCYEISPGHYDAYIWGNDVKKMTALGKEGCRIVTNLHADTLEQARAQIVNDCGADENEFSAFEIFIPVTMSGFAFTVKRKVKNFEYYNGAEWEHIPRAIELDSSEKEICEFINKCIRDNICLCPDVRNAWLEWLRKR